MDQPKKLAAFERTLTEPPSIVNQDSPEIKIDQVLKQESVAQEMKDKDIAEKFQGKMMF